MMLKHIHGAFHEQWDHCLRSRIRGAPISGVNAGMPASMNAFANRPGVARVVEDLFFLPSFQYF